MANRTEEKEVEAVVTKRSLKKIQAKFPGLSKQEAVESFIAECLMDLKDPQEEIDKLDKNE